MGALPMAAMAQTPFNLDAGKEAARQEELGGTAAIDIITLKGTSVGAPLRYGNVVEKSERVQLGNENLTAGIDYMMDYATGVVYLKRAQKQGMVLTVSYRYKPGQATTAAAAGNPFLGIQGFKYSVAPDKLNLLMGFGLTERAADGSVMQSNVFGFQNNFKFSGGGAVTGLYIFGDRSKAENQAGLNMDLANKPGAAPTDEGKSQFILQNLNTKVGGGTISADYQDISKNFTNFGTVKGSGYDDARIAQLMKEKGLTRLGFNMENVGGFSTSFRNVKDDKGGISWRSFGYNQGGLDVKWSSQKVDQGFARFQDLGEANRAQLQLEAGMSRQDLAAKFASKTSKLSFANKVIQDEASGKEITRKEYALDVSKLSLGYEEQEVSEGFSRFASLMGDEKPRYEREQGIKRQMMRMQSTLFGSGVPIAFSQNLVQSKEGEFKSQDLSVSGKTWSLEHLNRSVDSGFRRLDAMQDAEINGHITSIAKMYNGVTPNVPAERGWFLQSYGIDRSYTSLKAQPFRDWKFAMAKMDLKGQEDSGSVTTMDVNSKNVNMSYRKQELGPKFGELSRLMEFERQKLGTISGLQRTDFGLSWAMGGSKQLNFAQMSADSPAGDAKRTSVAFKDKKIDVQVTTREVSPGFATVNQLVDGEKDLLAAMQGFKQTEGKINWQLSASMNIQAYLSEARNDQTDELRRIRNLVLDWSPDKKTKFNYTKLEQKSNDPISVLFANEVERMTLARNFDRYGNLLFVDEKVKFDGKNAAQPDWHKQYFAYETKLNDKTSVKTEQSRTSYENGDKEDISANTVSTELSKRIGVSVTDTHVDRDGDDRDEKKRNYGFWFDLGNGLRMSYGYIRHLNGEAAGAMSSSFALGQNAGVIGANQTNTVQQANVGGMTFGGGYGVNTWDDQTGRTQSFSNVNISTAKPFRMLGFQNVKFNLGLDTAADNRNWLKENRLVSIQGNLAKATVGFEYKSQIHPSGYRGIDRTFLFTTDPSDKNWLRASMKYKVRTLPWDEVIAIRDFNVVAKPAKNIEISHQMLTNPEVVRSDVFLGSVPQAARANKWKVDYRQGANFTFGGEWQELMDEQNKTMVRTAGVNLKLFESKGSPLSLYYGLEQSSNPGLRRSIHRYSLKYDQKAGPNGQIFSLFLGNVSYQHNIADGQLRNNWTARLDYQFRF
jgi:hypothetical protein